MKTKNTLIEKPKNSLGSVRNSLESDLSLKEKKEAIFKDLEVMLESRERANSSRFVKEGPPNHYYAKSRE